MAENASIIHNVESIKAVLLDIILENKKMINEVNQIKTEMENQRQELNQQTRINRNLHNEIDKLKQELQSQESNFDKSSKQFGNDIRSVELRLNYLDQRSLIRPQLKSNIIWKRNATTIAGGHGKGASLNQLNFPLGIYIDHQGQCMYIADQYAHRIIQWKLGESQGQIIAGENGEGNKIDQLKSPTDVTIDQNKKSLIICDRNNRRIVRWSLENPDDRQIIISNIKCYGLMMNDNGDLFVCDEEKHEVKKWRKGEIEGTIVAGGHGKGDQLNQLNTPRFLFVDRQDTVYVSDELNHRVMKWIKNTNEGIVVAGGRGEGNCLNQLSHPFGLIVNEIGDLYVADRGNHRVMCWPSGSNEGRIVVGGTRPGAASNQLHSLTCLTFDVENNLYVVDQHNNRIQRFEVERN